ncbi:MAG: class II aldolase/adducin family protein [Anaerolineae bacterium]|jgi:rhamnose utilization protein RhaD (predicted bifunctional aldolase and dehydrogenase)
MTAAKTLDQLIAMSRVLGDPALDYAILGEGNSSARIDDDTFWVKASGAQLRTIEANGFVQVRFDGVLSMLEARDLDDTEVKARLEAARVDPKARARPSVETVLHALALQLDRVNFVGHTHPTAVNAILCSQKAKKAIAGRLFPDEIVYCGPAPVYIPYTDPGVPLARKVRDEIDRYLDEYRERPKVILMQNHGLIALGQTALEVENITAMYVKTARVILGAYALGGVQAMSPEAVARIHTRPDEQYRRQEWGSG